MTQLLIVDPRDDSPTNCDLRPYQFDREENLLYGGIPVEYPDLINQAVSDAVVKCDCLIVPSE